MDIRPLTDDFAVSAQIDPDDLGALASQGFTLVINNRPDGEAFGQPSGSEIEAAAKAAGLAYRHIPVSGMQISQDDIEVMAQTLKSAPGPVLAFCRSGMRSSALWALSQAAIADPRELMGLARAAGYDLSSIRQTLDALRAKAAGKPGQ